MRARFLSIAAVTAICACGGAPAKITPPPVVAAPPPPAYEVVRSPNLTAIAADEGHVYWFDAGVHRRAHGGASEAERLFVSDGWIDRMVVGSRDVFFVDDGYRLRALPKEGGAPSELAGLDEGVAAMVADGEGVWVISGRSLQRWSREPDERRLELPGTGAALAIDRRRGEAFVAVRDADATLYRVDLATGKATPLSSEWFFADALGLGVSGSSVVAAVRDGVVTIPRAGGEASLAMPAVTYGMASDGTGYAVSTDSALIAHARGAPPRLLARSTVAWTAGGSPQVALGGGYAYHLVYANDSGESILRGEPRVSGPEMLRIPDGADVSALAADGDRVYVATPGAIVELSRTGAKPVVTVDGYLDRLVAGGGTIAWSAGGVLFRLDGGRAVPRSEELGEPVALHKGTVYGSDGIDLRAIALAGTDAPFVVSPGRPDAALDSVNFDPALTLQFADDHLFFVQQVAERPSLMRVDERGADQVVWSYTPGESYLDSSLAVVGDAAYVHDSLDLFRVPLDGGAATTLLDGQELTLLRVYAVGAHLIVWRRSLDGVDELLDVPTEGGEPEVLWQGVPWGVPPVFVAAGATVMFVHAPELGAVLRIPVN